MRRRSAFPARTRATDGGRRRIAGAESPRKVLRVLLAFSADRPTATVEELAAEIGVPLSTAYRYVTLLREVGLLEAGESGIQVSPRAIGLARAAVAANGLLEIARPVVEKLREQTGESALLVRRLGDSAVCIHYVQCGQAVRLSFEPGQPLPLHGGASAKVLLASMPEPELARYLERLPELLPDAARRKALLEELPLIRKRGWAVSEAEVDPGVWAAAAAVTNGARVVAAASVAAPVYRLPRDKRPGIIEAVQKGAAEISAQMGPLHEQWDGGS